MEKNTIYNEVRIKSSVDTILSPEDKKIKIEELVSVASKIWKRIIEINLKKEYPDGMKLGVIQNEYREFFLSFPLVVRWMVEAQQFKINAFKIYLNIFLDTKIESKEDFLKLQGKYIVILYKELNPHLKDEEILEYEKQISGLLLSEDEAFKELEKEAVEEVKKENEKATKAKKEELYNQILKRKATMDKN
jgi:hypothetical protein